MTMKSLLCSALPVMLTAQACAQVNELPALPGSGLQSSFIAGGVPVGEFVASAEALVLVPSYTLSGGRVKRGRRAEVARGADVALTVTQGWDDNLLNSRAHAIASSLTNVRPDIALVAGSGDDLYTARYLGNHTRYASSAADSYDHHAVQFSGDNILSHRARVGWQADYREDDDPRGSIDRGALGEPDTWHAASGKALFVYGAKGAAGHLEAEASELRKRYDNHRGTTLRFDVNLTSVASRIVYQARPRMSLMMELRLRRVGYLLDPSVNNTNEHLALLGASWDAGGGTSGAFKLGLLRKDFSDPFKPRFTGPSWEGSLHWAPVGHASLDFHFANAVADSSGAGTFIVRRSEAMQWKQQWSPRTGPHANIEHIKSIYHGVARQDRSRKYSLGLSQDLGLRLRVGAEHALLARSSTDSARDFSRHVTLLTLQKVQ